MAKEFFIFADFDGPLAHVTTWRNDTKIGQEMGELRDLNLYELNYLDRACRNLADDVIVHFISISSWKFQFNKEESIAKVKEWANIKKLDLDLYKDTPVGRFTEREPWLRLRIIKEMLEKHPVEDYIILDDEFLTEYEKEHRGHCYPADNRSGYNYQDWEKIVGRIESWGLKEEVVKERKDRDEAYMKLLAASI